MSCNQIKVGHKDAFVTQAFNCFLFMLVPLRITTQYEIKVEQEFQEMGLFVCLLVFNVHKPWPGLPLYWPDLLISSAPF